jgi:PAS domain S-box-containing protein
VDYRLEDARLSDRERTVLLLAADGLTDKEIANSLGLSLKTIHTYWDRMRQKLSASTRTQVFAKFLRVNVDSKEDGSGLKSLFSSWEEGVWIISPSARTIYANQRIANTFGYTLDEFPKHSVGEVLREVGAKQLEQQLLDLQREGHAFETAIEVKDGQKHWLSLKGAPLRDDAGTTQAISILVRDISVEKRVRHSLDSCEAVLASLTDLSTDLIAKFDNALTCTYVNPQFMNVLGVPASDVVERHVRELPDVFSPNDVWSEALSRALQSGAPQSFSAPSNGERPDTQTWLLPEPNVDLTPKSILSVTKWGVPVSATPSPS